MLSKICTDIRLMKFWKQNDNRTPYASNVSMEQKYFGTYPVWGQDGVFSSSAVSQ
jgi:hypothetical protein